MPFQPDTSGYLITAVETVLLTGKRRPPVWLSIFTGAATIFAVIGGVVLLTLLNTIDGRQDYRETVLGVGALMVTILYPMSIAIRFLLHLENPITIRRDDITEILRDGPTVLMLAAPRAKSKPIWFTFNTRSDEEALTVERNLRVRAHGRLRVYPVTFVSYKRSVIEAIKAQAADTRPLAASDMQQI